MDLDLQPLNDDNIHNAQQQQEQNLQVDQDILIVGNVNSSTANSLLNNNNNQQTLNSNNLDINGNNNANNNSNSNLFGLNKQQQITTNVVGNAQTTATNKRIFKDSEVIFLLDNKHRREVVLRPEPDPSKVPRITYYWSRGSFHEGAWRNIFRKLTENKPSGESNELCWFDDAGGDCYKIIYSVASKEQRLRFSVFAPGKTRNVFHIRKLWGIRVKCWKGPGEIPSTEFSLTIWGQEMLEAVRHYGIARLFDNDTWKPISAQHCEEAQKLAHLRFTPSAQLAQMP